MFEPRELQTLEDALYQYEQLFNSPTFYCLNRIPLGQVPYNPGAISFIQITTIPSTDLSSYFSFVLDALASLCTRIATVMKSSDGTMTFYIGLENPLMLNIAVELLTEGLTNTYPGCSLQTLSESESQSLLESIFSPSVVNSVGIITTVPTLPLSPIPLGEFNTLFNTTTVYTLFLLATSIKIGRAHV